MKKIVIAILCLVVCCSALSSCEVRLKQESGDRLLLEGKDGNGDIYYSHAPMCIEAAEYENTVFIRDPVGNEFHRVTVNGEETVDLLYDGVSKDLLFNPEKYAMPEFSDLKVTTVVITYEPVIQSLLTYITDKADIESVVDAYFGNPVLKKGLPSVTSEGISENLRLKFASSNYSWLLYSVNYIEYKNNVYEYEETDNIATYVFRPGVEYKVTETLRDGETVYVISYNYGKYVLYDVGTGVCRMAGSIIHDGYIGD